MKLIIAGSRNFEDSDVFQTIMASYILLSKNYITEVVSGGAAGVDYEGECWAKARGIPVKRFLADWGTYGKSAGPIRNRAMAKYADAAVVIWNGESRGSRNMIEEMKAVEKPIWIARTDWRWE